MTKIRLKKDGSTHHLTQVVGDHYGYLADDNSWAWCRQDEAEVLRDGVPVRSYVKNRINLCYVDFDIREELELPTIPYVMAVDHAIIGKSDPTSLVIKDGESFTLEYKFEGPK